MSKYRLEIEHVDHEGTETTYIVQCVSFTRKELRKAAAQAGRDDDDTEIGNLIFSKVFRRDGGEDVEVELDDLPVDVFNEAYAEHPSFRVPDKNGTRRGRR